MSSTNPPDATRASDELATPEVSSAPESRKRLLSILMIALVSGTVTAYALPSNTTSIIAMFLWATMGPYFVADTMLWMVSLATGPQRGPRYSPFRRLPFVADFLLTWLVGHFVVFLLSLTAWALGLFSLEFLLGIVLVPVAIAGFRLLESQRPGRRASMSSSVRRFGERIWVLIAIIVSAAVMMIVVRGFSPPPFQFGWDMFQHSFISNLIVERSIFHPLPSGLSNSFLIDPYVTGFHLIISVSAFLGNGDALLLFWIGPFFNLLIFASGIALLARVLRLELTVTIGAVLFAVAFHEWHKGASLVYYAPTALITAFLPTLIAAQLGFPELNRQWATHFASGSLILLHFFSGLASLVVVYSIPALRITLMRTRSLNPVIPVAVLGMTTLTIIVPLLAWNAFNALFRDLIDFLVTFEVVWRVQLGWKIEGLTMVYYTLPLLAAGLAGSLIHELRRLSGARGTSHGLKLSFVSLVMLAALLIYFIEVEQTSRFLFLLRPGLMLLGALFCAALGMSLGRSKARFMTLAIVGLILLSAAFPAVRYINRQRWDGDTDGVATSFAPYEMEMGAWIKANLPEDILLISDPRAQEAILPFAMRDTLFAQAMPLTDQDLLRKALVTNSSGIAFALLEEIVGRHGYRANQTFLLVSGRTLFWADSNQPEVFRPKSITDYTRLETFVPPRFTLMHFAQDQIFLFSLNS